MTNTGACCVRMFRLLVSDWRTINQRLIRKDDRCVGGISGESEGEGEAAGHPAYGFRVQRVVRHQVDTVQASSCSNAHVCSGLLAAASPTVLVRSSEVVFIANVWCFAGVS